MTSAFAPLGLSEKLCETVARLGFEEPTPIQSAAVPELIKGGDVLGQAATGTGKTAAFALPAVEVFAGTEAKPGAPRVLVLTPTRELCLQVSESFVNLGQDSGLETCPIYGGQDYSRQIRLLKRGVHVVVATPGRALDHLHRGTLDLSHVQFFVMDEADEMLDMGFAEELEELTAALPETHQTALFSATLPERILEIANKHLKNPKHIVIEKNTTEEAPRVPQVAYVVARPHRLAALARILEVEEAELAICFARTRVEVDEVTEAMRARGFSVEALHGGLDQASRDRVMKRAKNGSIELIVATDVAARVLEDHEEGTFMVHIPAMGRHNVANALAAYCAATRLGLNARKVLRGISNFEQTGMRQKIVHSNGVDVIEDCYNANPDSMKAALAMFREYPCKRRFALLGDMLELGDLSREAHEEVGRQAAESGIDTLITYGEQARRTAVVAAAKGLTTLHANTYREAADALLRLMQPGDALLVKASRGMALEKVLELFYKEQQ